jgi:hypothetical protein
MDETATTSGAIDSSGNSNNGTYTGNASTSAGKFGNGGVFDGNGDNISVTDNSNLDFTNDITISAWAKPDETDISNSDIIAAKEDYARWDIVYGIKREASNDAFHFEIYIGGASYKIFALNPAVAGTWYHLVGTYNSDEAVFYVNGVKQGSLKITGAISTTNDPLYIGTINRANWPFDGNIDEVRLYNRALSAVEVSKLYEWAPGPVAHWKFDELNGVTAYDSSASTSFFGGNHGTLGDGAATYQPAWSNLGKYGGALSFDGVNDYINLPKLPYLKAPYSVSFWFNPKELNREQTFLDLGNSSFPSFQLPDNNKLLIYAGPEKYRYGTRIFSNGDLNKWWHVTFIVENGNDLNNWKVYLNGIVDTGNAGANTGNYYEPSTTGYISSLNTDYVFNGVIDDVRIYNYARTQKQILEDMAGDNGGANGRLGKPLAYYKFDEGFSDIAHNAGFGGTSLDGTLVAGGTGGNPTVTAMWDKGGKFNNAIEFDGANDYVTVADSVMLQPGNGNLSVSAWVKPFSTSTTEMIVSKRQNNGDFEQWSLSLCGDIACNGADGRYLVGYFRESATSQRRAMSKNIVNDGSWHNYSMVADSVSDKVKLFMDGKELDSTLGNNGTSWPTVNNTDPVRIGDANGGLSLFYGLIDEVKIYNYALNDDEIKQDYNQNKSAVMGSIGGPQPSGGASSSNSALLEYCVPGSTDYCAAPVGEWKMDENVSGNSKTLYDTSGNGYNGTTNYGANATGMDCTQLGKLGTGCNFDGVDDYTQVPAFSHQNIFTTSFWIKFNRMPSSYGYNPIFVAKKHNAPPWEVWNFSANNSTNKISFAAYDVAGSGIWINSDAGVSTGVWYYIVGTMDGTYNMNLYINGIKQTVTGNTGSLNSSDGVLNFGATALGGAFTNGVIDNVRIYEYVRTPAQITWEYNRGKPIAYWKFDECSGGIIHDNSGSGNNGTLNLGTSGVTATGTCASSSNSFWYNGHSGKINSSASFDGTNDYINVNDFNVTGDNGKQISAFTWVKKAAQTGVSLVDQWDYGASQRAWIIGGSNITSSKLRIAISDDGTLNVGHYKDYTSIITAFDNNWHYVGFTFNNGTLKLYIDGVEDINPEKTVDHSITTILNSSANITIGSDLNNGAAAAFMAGQIDEVKIFNYALTSEQVKQEYAGGAVRFGQ